jgi:hypothetical protein
VFLDTKRLVLGDDWDRELAEAQQQSSVTIVLVSELTDDAYYEREEIATAIALARRDPDGHRVVPVYLSTAAQEQTPYGLRLKHGVTLGNGTDLPAAAQRLLATLQTVRDRERAARGT